MSRAHVKVTEVTLGSALGLDTTEVHVTLSFSSPTVYNDTPFIHKLVDAYRKQNEIVISVED